MQPSLVGTVCPLASLASHIQYSPVASLLLFWLFSCIYPLKHFAFMTCFCASLCIAKESLYFVCLNMNVSAVLIWSLWTCLWLCQHGAIVFLETCFVCGNGILILSSWTCLWLCQYGTDCVSINCLFVEAVSLYSFMWVFLFTFDYMFTCFSFIIG